MREYLEKIKKGFFRKKFLIPALAGIISIGGIACMFRAPPDPEAIPGLSIKKYTEEFIKNDNAFGDYIIAARLHKKIEDSEIEKNIRKGFDDLISESGRPTNLEEAAQISEPFQSWIRQNQPAIGSIRAGLSKQNYDCPKFADFYSFTPCLADWKDIARVMIAQAKIKENAGDYKGAYNGYFEVMRFAWDISKNGSVVNGLVNLAIDSSALKAMQPGLRRADGKELEEVVSKLLEVEKNLVAYPELLKIENQAMINTAEYAMKFRNSRALYAISYGEWTDFLKDQDSRGSNLLHNLLRGYVFFNKPRIRRNLKNYSEKSVQIAESPLSKGDEKKFGDLIGKDRISQSFAGEAFGCSPITSEPAAYIGKKMYAHFYANLRGTRLRAATELYERIEGQYPDSLQELVNKGIIDKIPIDPFSNQQLKYADSKIYSLGPDFTDDKAELEYKTSTDPKKRQLGDIIF